MSRKYYENPLGYEGEITGEMRAPRSDLLWEAGTAVNKYLPGIGGALRNLGAGMRLEPKDYTGATLDALAVSIPAGKPLTTAKAIAYGAKPVATQAAKQYSVSQQGALPGIPDGILSRMKKDSLARYKLNKKFASDLELPLEQHDAFVHETRSQARINNDIASYFRYKKKNPNEKVGFSQYIDRLDAYKNSPEAKKRMTNDRINSQWKRYVEGKTFRRKKNSLNEDLKEKFLRNKSKDTLRGQIATDILHISPIWGAAASDDMNIEKYIGPRQFKYTNPLEFKYRDLQ